MNVTFVSDDLDRALREIESTFTKPSSQGAQIISDAMRNAIAENFASESGDGQQWQELAVSTQEDRVRQGFSPAHPILQRTKSLFDSLTNPNNNDHIDNFSAGADGITIEVGSNDERTGWLNDGTYNIPPRPFLTMDDQQQERLSDAVEAYFEMLIG